MAKRVPDLTGKRYGRWKVMRRAEKGRTGEQNYLCECECGTRKIVRRSSLLTGNSTSCGCYEIENKRERATVHGYSKSKLYRVWGGMVQRCCNNKGNYEWSKYGGRGITICDEWRKSFTAFRDWALENGYQEGLTVDRIDNNKGYFPDNCRWATVYEQNNNKRTSRKIAYNGEEKTVRELADQYGLAYSCLYARLIAGWNTEAALLTPSRRRAG